MKGLMLFMALLAIVIGSVIIFFGIRPRETVDAVIHVLDFFAAYWARGLICLIGLGIFIRGYVAIFEAIDS
jgi:hypothetical protein